MQWESSRAAAASDARRRLIAGSYSQEDLQGKQTLFTERKRNAMTSTETIEPTNESSAGKPSGEGQGAAVSTQQAGAAHCPTCGVPAPNLGGATVNFVYALGRIDPRFPRVSVEKEFAQVTGREKMAGLTDRQALHA